MTRHLIEIQQAEVVYQSNREEVQALQAINLTIEKGEFICLVGPSGCGKSTLLNLLAGYLQPTTGTCSINGSQIVGPDYHRGVVFQSPALYPWLSVRKNIEYGLKVRKIPKEERKKQSDFYLEQIDLMEAANRYPFELSGGMKQRVSLARTLVNRPELLLMDEPFGALDALTRNNMQALLRKIWGENQQTIFLITHDIEEALSLASRVLVMSKSPGQIIESMTVGYAEAALTQHENQVQMDTEFIERKNHILQLINQ